MAVKKNLLLLLMIFSIRMQRYMGISEDCVFTVGVTAPDDERCARIMARDGIDADYALSLIHI